ncbi:MAG: hypothetical protein AAF602_15510, partial [Myxococcota bacterium]
FSDCDCDSEGRPRNCARNFAGVARLAPTGGDQLSSLGNGGLDELTTSIHVVNGAVYGTVLDDTLFYSYDAVLGWTPVNAAAPLQGLTDNAIAFAHDGSQLFVGGYFLSIGGVAVNHIAARDGLGTWTGLSYAP